MCIMRKPLSIIYFLIFSLSLFSCAYDIDSKGGIKGNGIIVKENRNIKSGFNSIISSENLTVYISQANEHKIIVEADENIINLIGTDIENGELKIHTHKNIGRATKKVYIFLPNISALITSKGAILETQNTIKTDSLLIQANTGSFLKAFIDTNQLTVKAEEGSRLNLAGEGYSTNIDVDSGSVINALELQTLTCKVIANHGGEIKVGVSKLLIAEANSGGSISYKGEPKVDKVKSFSGSVQKY